MKKIICVLLIALMIISLCACGSGFLQKQNQFSVRADISDVKYYMNEALALDTEKLDCLEYYELYCSEVFPVLVRYRESGSEKFDYLLSLKTSGLDDYIGPEMDGSKVTLYQPLKAKIKTISKDDNYDIKKLTFTLDSNVEEVYVILDKLERIQRIICQFNHAAPDFDAYVFKQNQENDKKEVFVFEGEYKVLIDPEVELNKQNNEPERTEGYRYSISYHYLYNEDGSLKWFNGAFGETDIYSYDKNGMREIVTHTESNDSVWNSFKNQYIRDKHGLVKTVKSYTFDEDKATYQYSNSYKFSYSNNQIIVSSN